MNEDTYYNPVERIVDAFPEIDSDICTELAQTDSEYARMRQEASELKQAHPAITELFEGEGAISLSAEEHAALVAYIDLKFEIDNAERQQIYFRGHMDGFAYLKKIGAI